MSKRTNERMHEWMNERVKEWIFESSRTIYTIYIYINEIVFVLRFDQLRNALCVYVDNCVFLFHLNLIEFFFQKREEQKTSTAHIPTNNNKNSGGNSSSNSKQKRSIELANYYSKYTAFKYTYTHCNEQNCVCLCVRVKKVVLKKQNCVFAAAVAAAVVVVAVEFCAWYFFRSRLFFPLLAFFIRFFVFLFFSIFFIRRYNDGCRAMFLLLMPE